MFRLPRSVSAAALCIFVCTALAHPACCHAGFELDIDDASFRFNSGTSLYEVDIVFRKNNIGNPLNDIKNIALALSFSPALDGAQFVGVANTAANRLFPDSAQVFTAPPAAQLWSAAIQLPFLAPVTLPSDPAVAMTLQIAYDAQVNGNSDIIFDFSSYISTGDSSGSFTSTGGASGLTFTAVPEPSSCLLSVVALSGVVIRRRFRKRKTGDLAKNLA